jgi:hypothetical protein
VVAAVLNVAANRHFFCINDVTAAVLHEQALAGLGFTIEGSWPCLAISDPCINTGLPRNKGRVVQMWRRYYSNQPTYSDKLRNSK